MSGAFRYIPVLLFIRYNQYNTEFGIILASSAPLYKNVSARWWVSPPVPRELSCGQAARQGRFHNYPFSRMINLIPLTLDSYGNDLKSN